MRAFLAALALLAGLASAASDPAGDLQASVDAAVRQGLTHLSAIVIAGLIPSNTTIKTLKCAPHTARTCSRLLCRQPLAVSLPPACC